MGELANGKLFILSHSKHYVIVHMKRNLTLTFRQVIFERLNTGVVFYNTLYQKKKTMK